MLPNELLWGRECQHRLLEFPTQAGSLAGFRPIGLMPKRQVRDRAKVSGEAIVICVCSPCWFAKYAA